MLAEEFVAIVANDVRKLPCTPEELSALEQDIRGWLSALNKLKRDVEVQLAAQKARMTQTQAEMLNDPTKSRADWLEYKSGQDRWRVGAIRFMVSVEERMAYAKNLRASRNEKVMTA